MEHIIFVAPNSAPEKKKNDKWESLQARKQIKWFLVSLNAVHSMNSEHAIRTYVGGWVYTQKTHDSANLDSR